MKINRSVRYLQATDDTDDQNQCHGVENPDLYHSRMDKKKLYKLN